MIQQISPGVWRFCEKNNQVWDPEDPTEMMIQDVRDRRQSPPRQHRRRTYHQSGGPSSSGVGPSSSHDSRYSLEGIYGLIDQSSANTTASFDRITEHMAALDAQRAAEYAKTRREIDRLGHRMDRQWGPFDPYTGN